MGNFFNRRQNELWNDLELRTLRALIDRGARPRAIGHLLSRSEIAIRRKIESLGLEIPPRRQLTVGEIALLGTVSDARLGEMLGLSADRIRRERRAREIPACYSTGPRSEKTPPRRQVAEEPKEQNSANLTFSKVKTANLLQSLRIMDEDRVKRLRMLRGIQERFGPLKIGEFDFPQKPRDMFGN